LGGGWSVQSARDGPMGHRRETRSKKRGMRRRRLAVYIYVRLVRVQRRKCGSSSDMVTRLATC
jgi:hypothetical protein